MADFISIEGIMRAVHIGQQRPARRPSHFNCTACWHEFTVYDHREQRIVHTPEGQSFHTACYNEWQLLNPAQQAALLTGI